MKFEFIDKAVFFPEQGILAIGDLHIGYEQSLRDSGILIPETQLKDIINNLEDIIKEIKSKSHKLKKIIFLGDIKHYFGYEWREKFYFNKILDFLREHVKDENIILIKGNHDKFDFTGKKMKDYQFMRQKPIDNYIVDFYCSKLKLIIEIDGDSHDYNYEQDIMRQKKLESLGLYFLRFDDKEVKQNIDNVLDAIEQYIDDYEVRKTTPLPPFFKGE